MMIIITLLFNFLSACSPTPEPTETSRTYFESLNLSSPEAAVMTFVDAFHNDDFPTVFWVLSPDAQKEIEHSTKLLQYGRILNLQSGKKTSEILSDTILYKGGVSGLETHELWYMFDYIMVAAKQHGVLLIDLSGDVEILHFEEKTLDSDTTVIDVYTTIGGIPGEVKFRMVQTSNDRWRVQQVIVPYGNEEWIPWSVPWAEQEN